MTRHVLAMITILCLFTNCKKNNDNKTAVSYLIVGTWELRSNSAGVVLQNFPAGNGNIYKYEATTYEIYRDGMLKKKGTYRLVKEIYMVTGKIMDRIIYDDETNTPAVYVFIKDNTLLFNIGGYPSGEAYVRVPQ